MKDHELAQFVNRLTALAQEFGQTQQLRERIAEEVGKTLKLGHHASSTMQISPSCIGKACGCPRGVCTEANEAPEDAVTIRVPGLFQTPAALQRLQERRTNATIALRETLAKVSDDQWIAARRHSDDDTLHLRPTDPP